LIQSAFRGAKPKKGGETVESTSEDIINIFKDRKDPVNSFSQHVNNFSCILVFRKLKMIQNTLLGSSIYACHLQHLRISFTE
jgi:hypothetical protein